MKLVKIELITSTTVFDFAHHSSSSADPYQAMLMFEANNWKQLGECSYVVYLRHEDGGLGFSEFKGINGSAHLAEFMDNLQE